MKTKKQTKYYNIYGARYNKDKSRVNISLVRDKNDDKKEWATISLKTGNQNMIVKEKGVYLAVKFLEDFKDENEDEDEDEETLPF